MLKDIFIDLLSKYHNNKKEINDLWNEVENSYSNDSRQYHNLEHIDHLFIELHGMKNILEDWDSILLTLFYHDVVYDAAKVDNEMQSALVAENHLTNMGVSKQRILKVKNQILATQKHETSDDADTNYFLDSDLSILGQPWEKYWDYAQKIRLEYAMYPDELYGPGRQKVLRHFLEMERIYKTDYFSNKYEEQARVNLQQEWDINAKKQ